eukprot:tig00000448_g876.t1
MADCAAWSVWMRARRSRRSSRVPLPTASSLRESGSKTGGPGPVGAFRPAASSEKSASTGKWSVGAASSSCEPLAPRPVSSPLLGRSHVSIIVFHHFRSGVRLGTGAPFRTRDSSGTATEFQSPSSRRILSWSRRWRFSLNRSSNPIIRPGTSYFFVRGSFRR